MSLQITFAEFFRQVQKVVVIDGLGMRLTIVIMQRYTILQSCVRTTVVQQSERSHTVESSSPF